MQPPLTHVKNGGDVKRLLLIDPHPVNIIAVPVSTHDDAGSKAPPQEKSLGSTIHPQHFQLDQSLRF